ncbi:MAG: peptidylprolyl isomerase [Acidobacteriota bacterium]|nr:peptidylprolyl isomerase [Acidobacteriota bacterium]
MPLEINGELIEDAVIRAEAQELRPRYTEMLAETDAVTGEMQLRAIARNMVIERVVLQQETSKDKEPIAAEALDHALSSLRAQSSGGGSCITPMNESTLLEDARQQIKLDRLISKVFGKVAKPKQKELVDYYRKHPEEFEAPELIHAAHIIKNVDETHPEAAALEAVEQVRAKLDAGGNFAELADAHSDCPGAGGDLGWFARGQMVEEFEAVVFALQVGEISPIFRSPFGFHVAKLLEHKPAGLQPFNEIRAELEDAIRRARERRALDDYIDELIAKAEIRDVKRASKS